MEKSRDLEAVPADQPGWWTVPDEGYWQALLEQGKNSPQTAPPADYHEIFESLWHKAKISEISWDRVRHPGDLLHLGQQIDVYILGVDAAEERIALSLKRLCPNPWQKAESRYQVGQVIEGTVTNVVSFGAFIRVEEGLEGLVHVSELTEDSFLHPQSVIREGERVRVRVLNVDVNKRRLGLSLRQVQGSDRVLVG